MSYWIQAVAPCGAAQLFFCCVQSFFQSVLLMVEKLTKVTRLNRVDGSSHFSPFTTFSDLVPTSELVSTELTHLHRVYSSMKRYSSASSVLVVSSCFAMY